MRITRIVLQHFRNIDHYELDLTAPRTLIVGPNGVGKSTLVDAIAWALTGRCRGVNAKGEGQRDLIQRGADEATVTLTVTVDGDVVDIWRKVHTRGTTASHPTGQLLAKLGTTDGMVLAVLYAGQLFDLGHADAKALLMDALAVTVPADQLPGVDLGGMDGADLAQLEALYDRAYADRAAANRALKALKVPDKPKVVPFDTTGQKTVDEARAALRAEQTELQARERAAWQADAALKAATAAVVAAEAIVGGADQTRGTLAAHQGMLDQHQADLVTAQLDLVKAEGLPADPVDQLTIQARDKEILIDKLASHATDRGCVLSAAIPCLTAAAEFKAQVGQLKADLKNLAGRIRSAQARATAIAAAQQAVKDATRHVTYHDTQIAQARATLAQVDQAAASLPALRDAADLARQAATDAGLDLTTKRAVVDRLTGQLADVAAYHAALSAHQRAVDDRATLQADAERTDALVKLLGPNGVRLTALQGRLTDLVDGINRSLVRFGFQVQISVDPWQVTVSTRGADDVPYAMLSKGQRLWTAFAFQLALADASGLNLLVLDDVEAVVGDHLKKLTLLVMQAPAWAQILIVMAKADDQPVPSIAGLQVVRLSDQLATASA